jgi:hypothetical protein
MIIMKYYGQMCKLIFEELIIPELVKKFPSFTVPKGSLPLSQELATGPFSGSAESNPPTQTLFSLDLI